MKPRSCSRAACGAPAVATLTFVYSDSTAVVGPLALRSEPGSYDLCAVHAESLRVPRGWDVIRREPEAGRPAHSSDDLLALADAIREVGLGNGEHAAPQPTISRRKGHLAVLADV